ncbi:thiamine phosphate synthase [Sphingomonas hylomeconis]|uniref:Thiamine phosphate synthase n=1 Tax=Sphingomonas hylomeconis TaxID=1395958 RepID=A0ABV7SQQ9_9SPHN|nr:thiamine phosphate synthase [Sphingomonas hylomeconis]
MPRRHRNLPTQWLMTDERLGDDLWRALNALPRGSGVIFRHYATPPAERRTLFARVAKVARRNRLMLIVAGRQRLARADGVHGAARRRAGEIRTWPAHSRREAIAGIRAGADLLFVSPLFATRSHPGGKTLGRTAAAALLRGLDIPAIALGGMTARRFRTLKGFYGWAAIDAWRTPPA